MATYAYVENNQIAEIYDFYPQNWRNISNFSVFATSYPTELNEIGWYTLQKIIPEYDSQTQKLEFEQHYFENNTAYEKYKVIDIELPPPPDPSPDPIITQWNYIRSIRNSLMSDFDWRYERYERQVRLNIEPTDNLYEMDIYMQALADIPSQPDPFSIVWPTYNAP